MNILATSDTHGNLENLNLSNVDLAIFAGDVAPLRDISFWAAYDQLKWMNSRFFDFCNQWPSAKIVFIPGNHDFFPIIKNRFGSKIYRQNSSVNLDLKLAPNVTMLIDQAIEIDGFKIYGTPWVPIISYQWAFEAEHDKLKERFSLIPSGVDILVSHTPPRFNKLGVSLEYGADSENFGCSELADAIFEKKPRICFCGHIHSGDHQVNKIGDSEIWNVARVDESYTIAYEPTIIER